MVSYVHLSDTTCWDATDAPEALFEALLERSVAPDVLFPLLDRAAEVQRPGWEDLAERALADPEASEVAVRVALVHPCSQHLKTLAVQGLPRWLHTVDYVVGGEPDDATVSLLLEAPAASVRRRAAVMLGTGSSASRLTRLPHQLRDCWRAIIVASPAGDPFDDWDGYWLADILKGDEHLLADWLREWFKRLGAEHNERLPAEVIEAVAALPLDLRLTLIHDLPESTSPGRLAEVTRSLVGDDPEAAEVLLDRPELEALHEVAMRDGPSERWMERALVALDRGWGAEEIARATEFSHLVYDAGGGQHWQRKVDEFERLQVEARNLRDSRRELISIAGIAYFERRRDAELQSERRRRILG